MTIKEAILKTLKDNKKLMTHKDVYQYIIKNKLAKFEGKTPESTVSAILGDFIRKNDGRVKRIKISNATYLYYYSEYENYLNFEEIENNKKDIKITYKERDLHSLFVTYLKFKNIWAKTIYHEESKKHLNQKWIHPDIVGVEFINLKSKVSSKFLKTIDKNKFFNLYSYELKREIKTDYELKEAYFQAVSNSSWANYGYLVAFELNDNLLDELQRLNQSFGIGFILLKSNPYETNIIFNAKYRELDFKTLDRLCFDNKGFSEFIELIDKYLDAEEKYLNGVRKEFEEKCDKILKDEEYIKYCKNYNIPLKD